MDIDAVVTWVDGDDPLHMAKRQEWLSQTTGKLHSKAAIPLRFNDHGELRYCLRAIRHHAPWIRTIWLVTDRQVPSFLDQEAAGTLGIRIVDHRSVFRHRRDYLPTFNSYAIETMIWQIPGLTEHFLYFNDDQFLCQALRPDDFFSGNKVILRGKRVDWTVDPPKTTHSRAQFKAALLADMDPRNGFIEAHVAAPLRRSILKHLSIRLTEEFDLNASRRFRDHDVFSPVAMHNAECIKRRLAIVMRGNATRYISGLQCLTRDGDFLRSRMAPVCEGGKIMLCINDLGSMREKVPEIDQLMENLVGGPLSCERDGFRLDRPTSASAAV